MRAYNFDSSGKLARSSQEELQQADATTAIIAYTNGTMADGRPYYAYLSVKPSKYREFYELSSARQSIVLNNYGKIIVSGFASTPPDEVVRFMADKYGFDDNYEQAVKAEVSQQRNEFGAKKEEQRLMDIVAMIKTKKTQ
jgi:hypothetical protein